MAGKSPKDIIDEALEKGGVLAVFYFDVHSKAKENLQPSLAEMIGRITHEYGIISAAGEIDAPIENEGLWSTSVEVTLLSKDFMSLANLAIKYGPIGIEVIKPDKITLTLGQAQSTLLNVAQTAHDFSKFVMDKLMDENERREFQKQTASRIELGKRLVEKGKEVRVEKKPDGLGEKKNDGEKKA